MSWRREARRFDLSVRVPVGAEAVVNFPLVEGVDLIEEGGVAIWKNGAGTGPTSSPSFIKNENEFALFRVGSGVYEFRGRTGSK